MIEARTDGQWVQIEIILPNGEEEGFLDHCGDPEAVASYLNSLNTARLDLEQCRKDLVATEGILRDLKEDRDGYRVGVLAAIRVVESIGSEDTPQSGIRMQMKVLARYIREILLEAKP